MLANERESVVATAEDSVPDQMESVWSLAFYWLVAFAGVALFAAVLIAPKWERRRELVSRVCSQAAGCNYLADMNCHFNRVIDALKHDADFTNEMARNELGYVSPSEQRLPAPVLKWERPKPPVAEANADEVWAPFVRLFAHDNVVRQSVLITAVVFVVVSLTFFNPSRGERLGAGSPTCNSSRA